MEQKNYFMELNSINVNDKVEEKNGLTYLSWAYAWGEVKKRYPTANYKVYETLDGCIYFTDGRTGWVKTGVIINDIEHIEYLPIMDYKNKSIPLENITSFDVNKTIQRSLTKAVARHGLGLYIYAGEDLPEEDEDNFAKQVKQAEIKEIKPKKENTPKQEQKAEKKPIVSDSDLPFETMAEATQKFMDLHKENKNIQVLNELRDIIASKLYQLGNQDFSQAYSYYAKTYNKPTFEDLNENELKEVVARLDAKLTAKKEAQ